MRDNFILWNLNRWEGDFVTPFGKNSAFASMGHIQSMFAP